MDATLVLVLLALAALLLGAPLLGLIALLRVRELRRRTDVDAAPLIERIARLEVRTEWLARRLEQLAGPAAAAPAPSSAAPQPPAAAAPPAAEAPAAAPPSPPRRGIDLESIIAGRVLNRIGIVALLLAAAFFLKFAFDNQWIGPTGRVAIGLVAGTLLLAWSQLLLKRSYRYFSEGMAGLGAGVLYLSIYAAWSFYQLVPGAVAFAGMIVVTATLIALAVGRNSERLAFLALVGGFLTPTLLSTGENAQVVLFTYLAVLNGGLLVLARLRRWRTLEPFALLWSVIYVVGWHDRFYDATQLGRTAFFYALLFVQFAALPVLRGRRGERLRPEQIGLVLANAAWFTVALNVLLYREHRWWLTVAVLALSAGHLAAVRLLRDAQAKGPPVARMLYAGLALTFVTLAIPIRLEGEWITMAWAVEGLILVWSGFRGAIRPLRLAGLALLVLPALLLAADPIRAVRPLLNVRLMTFATVIACYAVSYALSRRAGKRLPGDEAGAFRVVGVAANLLAVWALSLEVWDFAERVHSGVERDLARQLGLSLLWVSAAAVLIVAGVRWSAAGLRWQGLVLIALTVAKVFLFDLSFLERAYRILSFFALGLVLLVVSFLYQKKLAAERSREGP